ncbi:alpha-N-arabinofuranosidase [Dyella koreensis]|uniref:non-reducing end alpha-L-arabinofuranosidase n=1 Tax=Dyella koreensis TaxID=311235 RepID=A0ABW8KB00_9GAMM
MTARSLFSFLLLSWAGVCVGQPAYAVDAQVVVHADRPGAVIRPEIYGQFAEQLGHGIDQGIWVGEASAIPNIKGYRKDVVDALKAIHVPVIRWPGGCFADEYHWRDGIGPRGQRPVRRNLSWGGEENNAFGTHEFMDFAELIGAKTYIGVNVGGGTAREMSDWLEYLTADGQSSIARERRANGRDKPWKVAYLGIGNEAWGCGGHMRPAYYADLYRQFATFVHPSGDDPSAIVRVASGANADDVAWTEGVMSAAGELIDAYGVHYYTLPTQDWKKKGSATDFGETEWIATLHGALHMDDLLNRHSAIMDKYDPKKRVALVVDEWGNWYDPQPGVASPPLYQQNSLRDALTAAMTLNIFHAHADRVRMANIAQMVNVLQAMILTDQKRMVLTPTYHVFDMYQVFQGATSLPLDVRAPDYVFGNVHVPGVQASAGRDAAGVVHVGLVNPSPDKPVRLHVRLSGAQAKSIKGRVLTAPAITSINTFDHPGVVKPEPLAGMSSSGGEWVLSLPPRSVVVLDMR